jgi:hypothetical protein
MFEILNSDKTHAQTRRDFMRLSAAGALGVGLSGWLNVLPLTPSKTPQRANAATSPASCCGWTAA